MKDSIFIKKRYIVIYFIVFFLIIFSERGLIFDLRIDERAKINNVTTNIDAISSDELIIKGFDRDDTTIFHSAINKNKGEIYIKTDKIILNSIGFSPQLFYTDRLPEQIKLIGKKDDQFILIYEGDLNYKKINQGEYHFFKFNNNESYDNYIISINTTACCLTFAELILARGDYMYKLKDGYILYLVILILSMVPLIKYAR